MDQHGVPAPVGDPSSVPFVGGAREAILIGITAVLGLALLAVPIPFPFRIALIVLVVAGGLALTFGRFGPAKQHLEELLYDTFKFAGRPRIMQRGVGQADQKNPDVESLGFGSQDSPAVVSGQPFPAAKIYPTKSKPRSRLEFDATPSYFASALSLAFLSMLIAWALMGGVNEILGIYSF